MFKYQIIDFLSGTNVIEEYKDLNKTQWYNEADLIKLQNKKLRKLLLHAYKTVPYYKKLFDDYKINPNKITVNTLDKIPILTKKIIRDNFSNMLSKEFVGKKRLYQLVKTGGTTGEPLLFIRDKAALGKIRASVYRSYSWAGLNFFKDRWISLWGDPIKPSLIKKPIHKLYYFILNQKILSMFGVDDKKLMSYYKIIKKFKPKTIRGYASCLEQFAIFLQKNNLRLSTNSIISTAESLSNSQKKLIEDAFDCKVFNNYSSREFMMAQDCNKHEGLHVSMESVILEVVDNSNKNVESGVIGRTIVTDLNNYAMPLIRYENGDLAKYGKNKCSCKRGLKLLAAVEGRSSERIKINNTFLPGSFFPHVFKDYREEIKEYQVIFNKNAKRFTIKIIKTKKFSEKTKDELRQIIKKYLPKANIEFKFVNKIPRTSSGKRKTIIVSNKD